MTIDELALAWPAANGTLEKVWVGTTIVWDAGNGSSPIHIDPSQTVGAGSSKVLIFSFKNKVDSSGYDLDVHFEGGCQK